MLSDPAPYDALMVGLIVLLPMLGLTVLTPRLILLLVAWLGVGAFSYLSSMQATSMSVAIKHTTVTLYLSLSMLVLAAYIAHDPAKNARLLMSGYTWAAVITAIAGIIGYFEILPGAGEAFTKFGRAKGTFKDPNVFGPVLVPALLYCAHGVLSSSEQMRTLKAVAAAILCIGLLVSFSRGAWFNAILAVTIYGYLTFLLASSNRFRIKLLVIAFFGSCVLMLGLFAMMQLDSVSSLFSERANIAQSYDTGPEGRFGGQLKALKLVGAHPLGIGSLEFARSYHGEDVHNVYLSMFLNSGWIGGGLYLALVVATICIAFARSLRKSSSQALMIIALASFTALAIEGLIIDTDHWRHFFILMGLVWGLALTPPERPNQLQRQARS